MYSFNFTLKKTGTSEYTIVSDKGYTMHILNRCNGPEDALLMAKAWASSWHSSNVEMEKDEQQGKQGD